MAYEGTLSCVPGLVASGNLSAHQFKFVTIGASGAALNTTVGGIVDGVLQDKPTAAGEATQVAFSGVSKVVAGALVNKGAEVMSDANGKAVTATTGINVAGRALEAAGADGELIAVLLNTRGYIPAV